MTETRDGVVARINAEVLRAGTKRLDVRLPRALAAGDVEHGAQPATEEVFALRDRQRHLAPHVILRADAAPAAVPVVEIRAVVPLVRHAAIMWHAETRRRGENPHLHLPI